MSGSIILTGSITPTKVQSTIVFDDMSFNHVSGTRSYYAGVGTSFTASSFGSGVSGGHITLSPTASSPYPTYSTFTFINKNCRITGYRMYTNVSGSDFPLYDSNTNGPKISYVSIGTATLTAPNSTSNGQVVSNLMYSLTSGSYDYADGYWETISTGATLNNPPEILDAGTLYVTSSANISIAPTAYSPTYFTFLMSIGAAFATKVYKFRFELDIEDLGW